MSETIKNNTYINGLTVANYTNNRAVLLMELKRELFTQNKKQVNIKYKLKFRSTPGSEDTKTNIEGSQKVNLVKKDVMKIDDLIFNDYKNSLDNTPVSHNLNKGNFKLKLKLFLR